MKFICGYGWLLDNKAHDTIQLLKVEAEKKDLVLLDFDTNGDIENTRRPLSHAALVKRYLEKKYPNLATLTFALPTIAEPKLKKAKRTVTSTSDKPKRKRKTKSSPDENGKQQEIW